MKHYKTVPAKNLRNCAAPDPMLESAGPTRGMPGKTFGACAPALTGKRRLPKPRSTADRKRKKLSLAIIGAGRLGTALAIALSRAGHSIELIVAQHTGSARRAARLIGGHAVTASTQQVRRMSAGPELLADVIIIATPDDAIASVAGELAQIIKLKPGRRPSANRVALHTSGALSAEVLSPLRTHGFSLGSFHPLVSISDPRTGAEWLARAFFSVQGDTQAVRVSRRMVHGLGGQTFTIDPQTKALYHAAALMASPNMTALVDVALEMLTRCGLSPDRARKVLLPLINSTLDNLSAQAPAQALTGTFKRGDVSTVKKHIEAISAQHLGDALEAYILLGWRSMKMANHQRASGALIEKILRDAAKRARPFT